MSDKSSEHNASAEATTNNEEFRNKLSTISESGKRVWIYPKKPQGFFTNARTIVAVILIAIMVITPFIKVGGHPLFLFNILERKFILFGLSFGPHDFFLFGLAFISIIVFVVLFTAIYGRVFCGWACPQTVFMEMVFRKIEYFIEGDAKDQRKLNAGPWSGEKIFKKLSKHTIFYILSFVVGNILLAYIIGVDELRKIVIEPPSQHLTGFTAMVLFSGLFYFIFSTFREQACTIVCPYGRLQSVLLDKNSLIVAYDYIRGEPRGKLKKEKPNTNGDCIDCNLCVDVCPTGIDIRNGVQLECVNCTACIDACDAVMDKIKKPRGLVRYDSLNGLKDRTGFKITPRIMAYTALLTVLISVLTYALVNRTDFEVHILRVPGTLYQEQPNNKISNLYNLNMVNKTFDKTPVELRLKNMEGEIKILGNDLILEPQGVWEGRFMLILNGEKLDKLNIPIEIGVYQNGVEIKTLKSSFLTNFAKHNEQKN